MKKIEKGAFIICGAGEQLWGWGWGGEGGGVGWGGSRGLRLGVGWPSPIWGTLFFFYKNIFYKISRLKFAKNKAQAEILKRIVIILCVYNTILCFYVFMFHSGTLVSITPFLCRCFFYSQNGQVSFDVIS